MSYMVAVTVAFTRVSMAALAPIHTRLPMWMGAGSMVLRREGSMAWFRVASTTLWPMKVPSPMKMPPWS